MVCCCVNSEDFGNVVRFVYALSTMSKDLQDHRCDTLPETTKVRRCICDQLNNRNAQLFRSTSVLGRHIFGSEAVGENYALSSDFTVKNS